MSNELKAQEKGDKALIVRNLRREFRNVDGKACGVGGHRKVAVDDLNLIFYEGSTARSQNPEILTLHTLTPSLAKGLGFG